MYNKIRQKIGQNHQNQLARHPKNKYLSALNNFLQFRQVATRPEWCEALAKRLQPMETPAASALHLRLFCFFTTGKPGGSHHDWF
jgi:hypothetical protein